jgi:hypothetical protein
MRRRTYRGGEGRNKAPRSIDRRGPDLPKQPARSSQAIERNSRGEEQPTDKARAQQVHKPDQSEGERSQREAAEQQPPWPGEPADHE